MLKKQLFIISLLFGVISSAMAADPVKLYGQLQVNGNQLCSEQGEPVVLRGVSYGWHNLWPRFYNKKSVKWLKEDWKCTVLRAAMGTCIEDNYIENPEHALNCINAVVKAAILQAQVRAQRQLIPRLPRLRRKRQRLSFR